MGRGNSSLKGAEMKSRAAIAFEAGKPLEEVNRAFDLMREGRSIRSVVLYG